MGPVVAWIVVAVVVALVILLVAGTASGAVGGGGVRRFVADLRAGLRRGPDAGRAGFIAGARQDMQDAADAEEGSVEEIFDLGESPESAYVQPEEIARTLTRATHAAAHRLGLRR